MSLSRRLHPVLRRAALVAVTVFALAPVACTSDVEDEGEEPVQSDAEELGAERCTRAPGPTTSCHVYRADPRTTIGCSWGQARRWMLLQQTGCIRVPGSACVDGTPTRQTREMASWPYCN